MTKIQINNNLISHNEAIEHGIIPSLEYPIGDFYNAYREQAIATRGLIGHLCPQHFHIPRQIERKDIFKYTDTFAQRFKDTLNLTDIPNDSKQSLIQNIALQNFIENTFVIDTQHDLIAILNLLNSIKEKDTGSIIRKIFVLKKLESYLCPKNKGKIENILFLQYDDNFIAWLLEFSKVTKYNIFDEIKKHRYAESKINACKKWFDEPNIFEWAIQNDYFAKNFDTSNDEYSSNVYKFNIAKHLTKKPYLYSFLKDNPHLLLENEACDWWNEESENLYNSFEFMNSNPKTFNKYKKYITPQNYTVFADDSSLAQQYPFIADIIRTSEYPDIVLIYEYYQKNTNFLDWAIQNDYTTPEKLHIFLGSYESLMTVYQNQYLQLIAQKSFVLKQELEKNNLLRYPFSSLGWIHYISPEVKTSMEEFLNIPVKKNQESYNTLLMQKGYTLRFIEESKIHLTSKSFTIISTLLKKYDIKQLLDFLQSIKEYDSFFDMNRELPYFVSYLEAFGYTHIPILYIGVKKILNGEIPSFLRGKIKQSGKPGINQMKQYLARLKQKIINNESSVVQNNDEFDRAIYEHMVSFNANFKSPQTFEQIITDLRDTSIPNVLPEYTVKKIVLHEDKNIDISSFTEYFNTIKNLVSNALQKIENPAEMEASIKQKLLLNEGIDYGSVIEDILAIAAMKNKVRKKKLSDLLNGNMNVKKLQNIADFFSNDILHHVIKEDIMINNKEEEKIKSIIQSYIPNIPKAEKGNTVHGEFIFHPSRSFLGEMSGHIGGVCWTRQLNILKNNPEMTPIIIIKNPKTENPEILGTFLLFERTFNGNKKCLIIRGVNPNNKLLAKASAVSVCDQVLAYAKEIAVARNIPFIVASTDGGVISNRPSVFQHFQEYENNPVVTLDDPLIFNGYNITNSCKIIKDFSK